jgi:DNA-binding transcriptional LysR family regulator
MTSTRAETLPDWNSLASWVAVVEAGSVSKGAAMLGVSQASVSQRIKQIEEATQTLLLDRATRPARPTAAGQRLFDHAKGLLTQADQMMESVRAVSRAKRLIVRFGCVDSFAATIGPILIRALTGSSHQIRLWSGIATTLDASIENRQLDLAVTTSDRPLNGVVRSPLFSEHYFAVVPRGFDTDKLDSLQAVGKQLPFIRYSARSLIGQQVDAYLQRHGADLERTCELDATDPLLSLVAAGMGFALTTPLCIWQSRQFAKDLRIIPLTAFSYHGSPNETMVRSFYLASREGELGTLPKQVCDLVRAAVKGPLTRELTASLGFSRDAISCWSDVRC